jgi:hypothetical protein
MQYLGPENKRVLISYHHRGDHRQSRCHQSHTHHHSGDIECPLDIADSDAVTDSTTDDAEPMD